MTEHHSWTDPLLPPGEPIPGKTYRADGWAYIDFPRIESHIWEALIEFLGEHYVPLSLANYGRTARGQLLVSPAGLDLLREFLDHPIWEDKP